MLKKSEIRFAATVFLLFASFGMLFGFSTYITAADSPEDPIITPTGLQIESLPDTKGTITQTEEPFHLSINRDTVQHGWITKADNSTVYAIYGKGLFWTDNATIPAGNKYFGISFGEKAKDGYIKHKKDTGTVWTTINAAEFSHLNSYTFDNNKTYSEVYYTTFASIPANHTRDFKIYVELEEKPEKNNFIIYFGTGSTVIEVDIGTDLKITQTGLDNETSYLASIDVSEGKAFFGQTDSTYDLTSDLELWISNDNNNTWDYSGNNNHGTAIPATLNQDKWVTGQVGNGLDLDGSNDYVDVADSASLKMDTEYTVRLWFKGDDLYSNLYDGIVHKSTATSNQRSYGFFLSSNNYKMRLYHSYDGTDPNKTTLDTTTTFLEGQWYHLVGIFNTTHLVIYVNGSYDNSVAVTYGYVYPSTSSLYIAQRDGGSYFNGIIDNVMIYNRTLNASEIADDYDRGLNGLETNVSSDGLVLWTKLDESGSLDYAADSSGEGNTGTLMGYPPEIVSGNLSYGMDFDGVEDYVSVAEDSGLRLNTGGTIEAWIYPISLGASSAGRIVDKSTTTTAANGYLFAMYSSNRLRGRIHSGTELKTSTNAVTLNAWNHVVMTFDSTGRAIYVNGIDVTASGGSETALPPNVAGSISIGNRAGYSDRTFNGTIDDVRIYLRALTSDEINASYHIELPDYETDVLTLSASAVTYDVISNENTSVVIEVPEVEYKLSFTPTYIAINYSTITFNTTDSSYFGQETITVTENYLGETNLTRIRINNSYAMGLYDIMNFNFSSYLSFSPNDIDRIYFDSYTGNSDNSTLKDTTDYSQWVDTCETGNTTGQVLCLNFNEGFGTSAHDRANNSVNNNDGTLTNMNEGIDNGTSGWTTEGKYGGGILFDGDDDSLSIGSILTYEMKSYWKKLDDIWTHIASNTTTTYINTVPYTCPTGMAYVHKSGGYCIDKYEASMPSANSTDMGNTTEVANRNNPGTMPAESKQGVIPWVRISQINARTACDNAGKHLCTSEEWLGAANLQGKIYNLPTTLSGSPYYCVLSGHNCVDNSYELGDACDTGSYEGCKSSEGVYDMVGNVWEWTNETVDTLDRPCGSGDGWCYATNVDGWSISSSGCTKYGGDGTYFKDGVYSGANERAVLRGGGWNYGAHAGPFCVALYAAPSCTNYDIGFRCCSAPN